MTDTEQTDAPLVMDYIEALEEQTPAEALEAGFCSLLRSLEDVCNEIANRGPERVVWRGRTFRRDEALASFEAAFETLSYVETYLRQHAKNAGRIAAD